MDNGFDVRHRVLAKCDVFILSGRIDGNAAPTFELAVRRAMDQGHYKIVLNLAGVNYMSSAGLRVLVSTSKECRKHLGGDVRLAEVNDRIKQVLELAGLDALYQIYDTEAAAIESFG